MIAAAFAALTAIFAGVDLQKSLPPLTKEERWVRCLDGSVACEIAPEIEKEDRRAELKARTPRKKLKPEDFAAFTVGGAMGLTTASR